MDSVSQFVLGSAVTAATLGPRVPAARAVVWGGLLATLPDLDILIDHGDAIQNMTRHRAESHALFWMTLLAPLPAAGIAALHRERHLFRRWWLAVWIAWITHALLDALTIYGTQLWLPFDDRPVALGSLFVVDPLYTLPLLVGTVALVVGRGHPRSRRWNTAGLVLSTAYAACTLLAQQHVRGVAARSLREAGVAAEHVVVSPAPFQALVWRVVAVAGDRGYEGYRSLLDDTDTMRFEPFDRGSGLLAALADDPSVERLRWFSGGMVKATRRGVDVLVTDLRMGAEPDYVFTFVVASADANGRFESVARPGRLPFRADAARGLAWLWRRIWDAGAERPR